MFAELIQHIKNTSPQFTIGQYADAYDNYSSWRMCKVINLTSDLITVQYDGWSQKYDETHKLKVGRVVYFRSHTELYTGAQKSAVREFYIAKEVDHIQQVIEKMQKLIVSDFANVEAQDVCQFVRGELYLLIDSVMQEQQQYTQGEFKMTTDLIEAFIRFFIFWANRILEKINIYIQGIQAHPLIYYFHLDTCLVSCHPEMFDTLTKIFNGGGSRCKRYFMNNEQQLLKMYSISDRHTQNFQQGFFKYFQDSNGLQVIENLITWQHGEGEAKQKVPFGIIKNILPLVEGIYRSFPTNQIKQEWLLKMKDMIINRLHQLTNNDLKESNLNPVFQIFKLIPQQFSSILNISQECEGTEIKLAITLIKSSILEKKIKGVKELTEIIDKVTTSKSSMMYQNVMSNYFNPDRLGKFLQEEKVFDILLQEAGHAEVFKRAAPILRFMVEQVNSSIKDIEQLWEASQMRHETEAQSVYEVISDIARVMNHEQMDMIFQKLVNLNQKEIDLNLINFMKDFTLSAFKNIPKSKKGIQSLNLMWDLLQDKSELNSNLLEPLMSGFIQCLKQDREQYQYQQLCLENLRRSISFPQCLHILQKIIESYGQVQVYLGGSSSEDNLNKIMKEHQMIDLIIRNLEVYRANVSNCQDCFTILSGKVAHAQRIQYKMDFLEYIAASPKKYEFSLENFKKLWNILIINPIHETDRNPMLDFLVKGGFRVKEDLFKNIFCNINYPIKLCYKSIEKYFMQLNQKNGSINCQKSQIRILKYDQIVGINFFFDVAFNYPDSDQAIQTLLQLHMRTEKANQVEQKLQMWNSLLMKCKEALKQSNNQVQIQNVIKCLKDLVTGIEGKQYFNTSSPAITFTKFQVQIGKDDKTLKEVSLPSNSTLLAVRKHLNQLYNFNQQDFDMFLANHDMKVNQDNEEDLTISLFEESKSRDKPDIILQNISQNMNSLCLSIRKFKANLSSNTELSEILFDLLQSENYEDIWEVLTLMPQNKQIKDRLDKGGSDEDSWSKILYFNCNKKLLYCLQIYETMIQQDRNVGQNFLKTKGCQSIINYYLKRQENEFTNLFNLKCYAQIAKIIGICNIKDQEINRKCVKYIIYALQKIENKVYQDPSSIQSFLQNNFKIASTENVGDIQQMIKSLIQLIDPQIRKTLCQQLIDLKPLHKHFQNLGENLQDVMKLKNQAEQYLELYAGVLEQTNNNDLTRITQRLPEIVISFLQEEETEKILLQAFRLICILVTKCQESLLMITTNESLADSIINSLFQLNKKTLQSQDTRKAGYEIVQKLFANQKLMLIFEQYFSCAFWRTSSNTNWNIVQTQQSKSQTGFVGLRNLGCICYMNSLMQQLFTLPNFRESILSLNLEQGQQTIAYQFQLLLSALKNSQKQFYDPTNFCSVLGPNYKPINFYEQMDVDEFFLQLMDKLELELKPLKRDMIVPKSFGGFMSTEFISKGCQHQSSREELFLALSLQVKNKKNIYESMKMMTDGEMLEGDNAYMCEKCEKKVPALMRVCIKQLPNVLIMVLKRFEFNYETQQKFKLNDYYEFPTQLNMKQFTKEYLQKQDYQDTEDADRPIVTEYSDEYYDYHLRGVIIHVGTADHGHYYSLIKDAQTNKWYEFNDILVKPFEFGDLATEAFGNDDKGRTNQLLSRSKNAYMLFYERKTYFDENGKPLKNDQELRWFFNNNKNEKQNDEILIDNIKFQISQVMFDEAFFEFSCALLDEGSQIHIGRFCLQYFLTVVIRFQERGQFVPRYLEKLKQITRNSVQLANEFLISIQNIDVLNELILQNPIQDMRVIIGGLINDAIKCLIDNEKYTSYKEFKQKSNLIQLTQSMIHYIQNRKNSDQIQRIIYQLSLHDFSKTYLRELKGVGRIFLYFLDEPPVGAGYIEITDPNVEQKLLKINKQYIRNEQIQQNPQILQQQDNLKFDNLFIDYSYIVMALNQLIYQDDDELCMLDDPQLFKRLLSSTFARQPRLALKEAIQKYIKLNNNPWDQSLSVVQTLYEHMKDCDEKDLKTTLIVLRGIGEIDDAYIEQRLTLVAEAFISAMKDNLGYWYYTSIMFDYIIKICTKLAFQKAFVDVLNRNKGVLKLMYQWLKESQNPFQNFSQQRWKVFKKRQMNVLAQDITEKLNKFQALSQKRIESLEKIMNQQVVNSSGYDSDTVPNFEQQVDVIIPARTYLNNFETCGYSTWTIGINLGDMMELRQNNMIKWVFSTDSSLAPPNTQTIKYENHVSFMK
ncbi:unnamed protein product [Paramecium pentaurelia]|uniref:USP domain-containing protein n=1 Tax=Paramecium pentaurelia TaxID=43138 RepID=A0A8S1VDM2_9CILI|nr:unnamed protein product [Paramecium pentaurelia]